MFGNQKGNLQLERVLVLQMLMLAQDLEGLLKVAEGGGRSMLLLPK